MSILESNIGTMKTADLDANEKLAILHDDAQVAALVWLTFWRGLFVTPMCQQHPHKFSTPVLKRARRLMV